jgi:ubiquinone/menaquinone biosynthesis C-methylase UbiE
MLERTLEPEVMEQWDDAVEYDAMDFSEVNASFARRALEIGPPSGDVLDCGTGTGRIPILIAQQNPNLRIIGVDMSSNMLKIGESNVSDAALTSNVRLQRADATQLPFPDNQFDMVVSNSLIHHLPDPLPLLKEVNRVIKPNGCIFIRDLMRPHFTIDVQALVKQYCADCNDRQRKLFQDSLLAAFTIEEIDDLLSRSGIHGATVVEASDRHWSIERRWYRELKKDFPLGKEKKNGEG